LVDSCGFRRSTNREIKQRGINLNASRRKPLIAIVSSMVKIKVPVPQIKADFSLKFKQAKTRSNHTEQ